MHLKPMANLSSTIPIHIPTNPMQSTSQEIYTKSLTSLQYSNKIIKPEISSSSHEQGKDQSCFKQREDQNLLTNQSNGELKSSPSPSIAELPVNLRNNCIPKN